MSDALFFLHFFQKKIAHPGLTRNDASTLSQRLIGLLPLVLVRHVPNLRPSSGISRMKASYQAKPSNLQPSKDYKKKGKLASYPFEVQHPFASFKVSGGALADTRTEIVLAENDKVIFKSTGQGRATLQPVVVDLSDYLNQEIYIRIIDNI